jgi:hypothetical protein
MTILNTQIIAVFSLNGFDKEFKFKVGSTSAFVLATEVNVVTKALR